MNIPCRTITAVVGALCSLAFVGAATASPSATEGMGSVTIACSLGHGRLVITPQGTGPWQAEVCGVGASVELPSGDQIADLTAAGDQTKYELQAPRYYGLKPTGHTVVPLSNPKATLFCNWSKVHHRLYLSPSGELSCRVRVWSMSPEAILPEWVMSAAGHTTRLMMFAQQNRRDPFGTS